MLNGSEVLGNSHSFFSLGLTPRAKCTAVVNQQDLCQIFRFFEFLCAMHGGPRTGAPLAQGMCVCGHASASGRHTSGLCIEYLIPSVMPPVGPRVDKVRAHTPVPLCTACRRGNSWQSSSTRHANCPVCRLEVKLSRLCVSLGAPAGPVAAYSSACCGVLASCGQELAACQQKERDRAGCSRAGANSPLRSKGRRKDGRLYGGVEWHVSGGTHGHSLH